MTKAAFAVALISAGACSVSGFRCRYDYTDDIERARCSKGDRLIVFRSLP